MKVIKVPLVFTITRQKRLVAIFYGSFLVNLIFYLRILTIFFPPITGDDTPDIRTIKTHTSKYYIFKFIFIKYGGVNDEVRRLMIS